MGSYTASAKAKRTESNWTDVMGCEMKRNETSNEALRNKNKHEIHVGAYFYSLF